MKNIIITTTNTLENCPVIRYIDFICTNTVLGTNIFSDIAASFTDFFGGKSKSYQNKLELIQRDVITNLKNKAEELGANTILSCRIDFDEISGGGKSMFMVSASGTACVVDISRLPADNIKKESGEISNSLFLIEKMKEHIFAEFEKKYSIPDSWVDFLTEHPQDELIQPALRKYIKYSSNVSEEETLHKIKKVLSRVDMNKLINECYLLIADNEKPILQLITDMQLFSAQKVLELCKTGNHKLAINILPVDAPYYNQDDVNTMKEIAAFYDSLPDAGKIEKVKGGLLGKESEKYICQHGHKSLSDSVFCELASCMENIKGLNPYEIQGINEFKNKIRILEKLLIS